MAKVLNREEAQEELVQGLTAERDSLKLEVMERDFQLQEIRALLVLPPGISTLDGVKRLRDKVRTAKRRQRMSKGAPY